MIKEKTVITATCTQAQQTTAQSSITTLLVADGQCPKIRQLLAKSRVPVLWLEGDQEPLAAISEELSDRRSQGEPVQALHWVSHGSPGVLRVGEKKVDRAALLATTNQLINWRLDQLAIWACNYGADNSALSLWEELLGASIYSSKGILGLVTEGQKHWTLHSKRHSKTIDWPLNFGDSNTWDHQLATVSYATFSEGPQTGDPLTSSEQITAVGYAASLYSVDTAYVKPTFDAISNFNYTTYTDDYSFLDSAITVDLVYITLPQSAPSTSQLDNLKQFVEGGGTLLINGEWSPIFDDVNGFASQILAYVGSTIVVKQGVGTLKDDTLMAYPPGGSEDIIEIGNYDITSGIGTVFTNTFGALEIDNESAEPILITSVNTTNNIVMAREVIGSGNAIVFADVNMFNADNNNLFSNIIIQSKLNIENANAAPVLTTPTAGTITETAGSSDTTTSGLSGTLSATDADGDTLTYSITDGSTTNGISSHAGSYGSLTVDTSSGEYTYTPDSSAVEALDDGDSVSDSFTINASDGLLSDSATYTVNLTGAYDSSVIIEGGTKPPREENNNNFTKFIFDRKNSGFQAEVYDQTLIKGRPLSNTQITGVTEGDEDTVNIILKNNGITNSEFDVQGRGGLNLEVRMKSGNPFQGDKLLFAKNTVTGSDTNDSIKFTKARFLGNEIDVGKGRDTIKFGKQVKYLGESTIKLGSALDSNRETVSDGDVDIIKFNWDNGSNGGTRAAKFTITEFGKEDKMIIKENGVNTTLTYDALKQNSDLGDDYFQIQFLD